MHNFRKDTGILGNNEHLKIYGKDMVFVKQLMK